MDEKVLLRINDLWGKNQHKSLTPFFTFAFQLPSSLTYCFYSFELHGSDRTKRFREKFNRASNKREVFRYFGTHYGAELLKMGIANQQIDRMISEGIKPKGSNGEPLDITIDHIKSLSLGGGNSHRNLCLMPGKHNSFKDRLEKLQLQETAVIVSKRILTIVPANNGRTMNRVPYFEGGYKPRISNAGLRV